MDVLKPSGLDKELEQKTVALYKDGQAKTEQAKKDQENKQAIDKFDEIRKMGFISGNDFKELWAEREQTLKEKEEKLNKLIAEVDEIRERFKQPKNSGALDDPKPKAKNPLMIWDK